MKIAALALLLLACAPHPSRPSDAACAPDEIDDFIAACVDPTQAIVIHCQQFASTHARCAACLRPKSGEGPVIERPGAVEANLTACRARGGDPSRCADRGDPLATLRAVSLAFCAP